MNLSKYTFPVSLVAVFALVFVAKASIDFQPHHQTESTNTIPNNADIGFAQDMAVHHNQAVEMSELAIHRGSDQIKLWGERIRGIQRQEIGRFMGWLDIWNAPHIASEPMAWMHNFHNHNDTIVAMGMATPDEMNQLRSLNGEAFDVLFLQLMIRHHQGGVLMAQAGVEKAATYTVRHVCQVIAQGQSKEIFDMAMLLKAKGGQMLPFGVAAPTHNHNHNHNHNHHAHSMSHSKTQPNS